MGPTGSFSMGNSPDNFGQTADDKLMAAEFRGRMTEEGHLKFLCLSFKLLCSTSRTIGSTLT